MNLFSNKKKNDTSKMFHILFDTYNAKVYRTAFYILKNEQDSKDVVQETFIKAYNKIDSLKEYDKFEGWIYRISFNLAIQKYKTNKRELPVEDLGKVISYIDVKTSDLPEKILEAKEHKEYIAQEINNLKIEYKEIILLYYYLDLSYEEISEVLNLKIGTVKSRLFRAKEELRKKLRDPNSMINSGRGEVL
ncbi:RNA polymerase sigma factor [Alkaliphilus serpentinus]|uniref:Sigma-70 family RNA polymerase sigma factor n=1 Tax=Alkaliphilus serpentinus TaxID=1482731 RepID=A0A833HLD0_9FIRM|nr:sigma-70 family RNA polymerase sigma factor [Alkaliphilus serpentinus]KAB3525665.1 sigma-70 family RNA polymerase sigma factor [Alkaliphilus serpentinus]